MSGDMGSFLFFFVLADAIPSRKEAQFVIDIEPGTQEMDYFERPDY